ncbi:serine/threonine-protein kinase [Streptomyces sp. NPDC007164]|uniref:serine/threonine-protein kinase n=1 Tax=Streptomyces sp. NPDC007164 TaxID=3156918 RepID=UPI0033C584D7
MATDGAVRRVIDGRFELLERLGGGGMGLVWRARDTELHREVALKEVRPLDPRIVESAPKEAAVLRERVLREARALARLRHPHVVTIFHIVTGRETEFPWLVMELVPGGTLEDRLARGLLSPREAARLGRGLLAGLGAAHAAGILHRDVKPANVLMREDGSPVLTDFGIAALGELSTLTTTGALIGSPEYIAPERLRNQEGNPASDLWSLGMLLYVAVEGAHPLRRGTVLATLTAVLEESVPAPARAGALAPVLTALLDRDPDARPDAALLDRLLAGAEAEAEAEVEAEAAAEAGTAEDTAPQGPGTTMDVGPERSRPQRESTPSPGPAPAAPGYADLTTRSSPAPVSGGQPHTDADEPSDAVPKPADTDTGSSTSTSTGSDDTDSDTDTGAPSPRRRRPARALVGVAVALALIGVGLTYLPDLVDKIKDQGASAIGAGPQRQEPDEHLFTPKGMREAIAALKPVIGGTTVSSMSSHGSNVSIAAPRKDRPEVLHWYSYRDGKVEDEGPAGVTKQPPTLDLSKFDWDLLPGMWREARTGLGIKNAERSHMILHRDPDTGLFMTLYVRDDYGNAYMDADNKGKVTERHPRETAKPGH